MTCLAPSATVRSAVSVFVFVLALAVIGLASPAGAGGGNPCVSTVDQRATELVAIAPCPVAGEESDGFHASGHCSAPCSPQVGAAASQIALLRIPLAMEYAAAGSAPIAPRTDAPDPFPPRLSAHA
jgi:hypothetical protein